MKRGLVRLGSAGTPERDMTLFTAFGADLAVGVHKREALAIWDTAHAKVSHRW